MSNDPATATTTREAELERALAALLRVIDRTVGYASPDDQAAVRIARAVLGSVGK